MASDLERADAEADLIVRLIERARELGKESAHAYFCEFDEYPDPETIGDWDSTAWGEDWPTLKSEGAIEDDSEDMLDAWREGFWDGRRILARD